jgi:hypothetical protein
MSILCFFCGCSLQILWNVSWVLIFFPNFTHFTNNFHLRMNEEKRMKLRLEGKMASRKTLLCKIKHNLLWYSQYKTWDTKHPLMSSIQHTFELFWGCFTWFYVKSCSTVFMFYMFCQRKHYLIGYTCFIATSQIWTQHLSFERKSTN